MLLFKQKGLAWKPMGLNLIELAETIRLESLVLNELFTSNRCDWC